ncbi:MAG: Hpt domain-containing protein [Deltaproteobacteria bacterium]|nr:Hpt domain-containing protein [Deltaproteobacteria bacterium]
MSGDSLPLDPELQELFRAELERRASAVLAIEHDPRSALRNLHALRGAAAMMGAASLAAYLLQLEKSIQRGESLSAEEIRHSLISAITQTGLDASPLRDAQPSRELTSSTPPARMRGSDPPERGITDSAASWQQQGVKLEIRQFFLSESRQRVEQFSRAIARISRDESAESFTEPLREAFRHVHAIKGSASTVGFDAIASATHALESALAKLLKELVVPSTQQLAALSDCATLLGAMLTSPERSDSSVTELRAVLRQAHLLTETAAAYALGHTAPAVERAPDAVRVPSAALHGLEARMNDVSTVTDRLEAVLSRSSEHARALDDLSSGLDEGIRRLGPARPWGVPAEVLERFHSMARILRESAISLDTETLAATKEVESLTSMTSELRQELQRISMTTVQWLYERVAPVARAAATTVGVELRIERTGEDVELARNIAERLVEPMAQLVRNAVVHGIEAPTRRMALGKPVRGRIALRAVRLGEVLRLTIEDDGSGVDTDAVRRAGERDGLIDRSASHDELLSLLFHAGFSTRSRADTSAGRGVGLDIVQRELIELGGSVSIHSTKGRGTEFVLELPARAGMQRVLVVGAGNRRFAIPIDNVIEVRLAKTDENCISLLAWLGLDDTYGSSNSVVELSIRSHRISRSVDWVERAREVIVRPLPAWIAGIDSWSGAIVEPDGGILLVLDTDRLAAQHEGNFIG